MRIKNNTLLLIMILISTLIMGIGYASVNSITGEITGTVIAESQTGVFITDVIYASDVDANSKTSEIQNYLGTMMKSRIELSNSNSSSEITYKVIIYNNSNCEYGFEGVIYGDEFYDNKNITFSITGITKGDIIKPKEEKKITITFKYKDGKISENNILNSYLNFKFTTIYRIAIQNNEPYNVTYNGKEQKWVPIVTDINGKILTENIDYTVSYNTTNFIDAGEIEVTIIGQNNYVGTITKKYTIEKAPLKVTTSSASKVYDGYPLTDSGIIIDGIVGDDEITANITGSQTEVGASANPCEVEFKSGKDSNYNMEIQWGTLKVVAVAVGGGGNGITETNSDVFNVAVTSLGSLITFDGFDADGGYRVGDQIEFEASIDNTKYNQLLTDIVVQVGYKSKLNGSITVEAGDDYSINGDTVSISLVEPGVKKNIKFSYLVMAGDGGIKGSRKKYYAQMTAIKENLTKIYVYKETKEVLIEPEPDDGNG